MPTYEYRCKSCGHELEAVQAFSDDPLTECPSCGGELRKKFSAVGISFKGSGFYKTDSRSSAGSSRGNGSSSPETTPPTSGDGGSDGSSTPAAASSGSSAASGSRGGAAPGSGPSSPGAGSAASSDSGKTSATAWSACGTWCWDEEVCWGCTALRGARVPVRAERDDFVT